MIASPTAHWTLRKAGASEDECVPFAVDTLKSLAADFDLLTTEADLMNVVELTGGKTSPLWAHTGDFKVRSLFFCIWICAKLTVM